MSSATEDRRTTTSLRTSTRDRLAEKRAEVVEDLPVDDMSWDEFFNHLADIYEEHEG